MLDSTTQSVLFPGLISKPIVAAFDQVHSSSDGGGLLLKAIDERLRLSQKLATCLRDGRQPGKVRHEIRELFRQRMFAIALGHPDCNDARELAFYHGHYGTRCFLPLIGTIAFNREKRQSLLCAVLRPGDAENRIKELKQGLELGRTSCSSFMANQLRVQLTAAAYVLMQELATQARHTTYRDAQVTRLRDRLLKLPVWVEESVRRVVLHLPDTFMAKSDWQRLALAVGGASH